MWGFKRSNPISIKQMKECDGFNFFYMLLQVDCSIPRLADSALLFGVALRLCQQLKDKVGQNSALKLL